MQKAQSRSYRKLRPWAALTVTTSSNESALVTARHNDCRTSINSDLLSLYGPGVFAPRHPDVALKLSALCGGAH